jgi:hypothetical protein
MVIGRRPDSARAIIQNGLDSGSLPAICKHKTTSSLMLKREPNRRQFVLSVDQGVRRNHRLVGYSFCPTLLFLFSKQRSLRGWHHHSHAADLRPSPALNRLFRSRKPVCVKTYRQRNIKDHCCHPCESDFCKTGKSTVKALCLPIAVDARGTEIYLWVNR